MIYDIVFIGAGASALMCAAHLPKTKKVLLIDANEKPARNSRSPVEADATSPTDASRRQITLEMPASSKKLYRPSPTRIS